MKSSLLVNRIFHFVWAGLIIRGLPRAWNSDGTTKQKLLIEQTYPGINDEKEHFAFLIKAFKDGRYVKVDGKPLLYIYDPISIPIEYLDNFRLWTKENGFNDLYLVANISSPSIDRERLYSKGFDAVTIKD